MTSKHSLWTRWVQQNKRYTWLYVINSIVLLFFGPVRLIYDLSEQGGNINDLRNQARHVQGFNIGICFLFILLAVFAATIIFSYLHSQKKIDFYHSQPMSEGNRFFNLYSGGLLCNYIPYIITFLLNLIITKCYGVFTFDLFQQALATALIYMLAYFAAYQIAVLMTIITGNILYSVTLTGIAFISEMVFRKLVENFSDEFFRNYCTSSAKELLHCKWSAVWALLQKAELVFQWTSAREMWKIAGSTCIWVAILSVLTVLVAYFAYRKRPAEYTGPSLAFSWTKPVIKVLVTIQATLLVINLFYAEQMWSDFAIGGISIFTTVLIFIVLSSCVCHVIFEFIWELDIRALKNHIPTTLIATGCTLIFFCSFYFDWFGYDTYVPNTNDVKSVGIVLETYYSEYDNTALENMELFCIEEACEAARELCQNNIPEGIPECAVSIEDIEDCWTEANVLPAFFAFHMKDGSTCYRTYQLVLKDGETPLPNLTNSEEYKRATYLFLYDNNYMEQLKSREYVKLDWCDKANYGEILKLRDKQQIEALQNALKADFEEHFESDPFISQDTHIAIGRLTIDDPASDYDYREDVKDDYLIFPEYTRTLQYLKELGIKTDMTTGFTLENISSVKVFNTYDSDNKKTVKDPERMKELLALTTNYWQYMGNNISDYVVKISLNDDEDGDGEYCRQLHNPVPDWAKELFEK